MAKLTEKQRKALDEYLEDKKKLIDQSTLTASEVAEWCREALKFAVDVADVTRRVGTSGLLWKHTWPGSERATKGRASSKETLNFLIQQMEADRKFTQMLLGKYNLLVNELGAPHVLMPSKMPTLPGFEDIVAQAGSELADTDLRDELEK